MGYGSLVNRGGVWTYRRSLNGKDKWTSTGFKVAEGRTGKNAATKRMYELHVADRNEELGWTKQVAPTFQAWWETYRKVHLKGKSLGTQRRDIGTMTNHALPFFGNARLDQIPKSMCMAFLEKRRQSNHSNDGHLVPKQTAEGTVQRDRRFLQAFFQQAIEDGYKFDNPWRGIERIVDGVRDRVVTDEEERQILPHLSSSYQRCFKFLLEAGLRIEELRGIDVDADINWDTGWVTVTGKGEKTRDVPVQPSALVLLQQQIAAEPAHWVIVSGQRVRRFWPQTQQRIREAFIEAAKKAGIPHVTPHTLRHTFGHRWIKSGGNLLMLARILGHISPQTTLAHYAHVLKEDVRHEADRVFALWNAKVVKEAADEEMRQIHETLNRMSVLEGKSDKLPTPPITQFVRQPFGRPTLGRRQAPARI